MLLLHFLILIPLASSTTLNEVSNARQVAQLVDDEDLVLVVWGSKACGFCRKVEEAIADVQEELINMEVVVVAVRID